MAALTIDADEVATFRDVVDHRLFRLQLMAQLIEIRHFDLRPCHYRATSGLQVAKQQFQQRGLAGSVGPEQADAVAALQHQRAVANQGRSPCVRKTDIFRHYHLLAGLLRRLQLDVGLALALAALAAFLAHGLERAYAALVAGAAGLDALANPHFLLGQALVEQRIGGFLGGQLLFLVHQEAGVVAVPVDQAATVQLENARGQVLQEESYGK